MRELQGEEGFTAILKKEPGSVGKPECEPETRAEDEAQQADWQQLRERQSQMRVLRSKGAGCKTQPGPHVPGL